jgi:hypothetical protein
MPDVALPRTSGNPCHLPWLFGAGARGGSVACGKKWFMPAPANRPATTAKSYGEWQGAHAANLDNFSFRPTSRCSCLSRNVKILVWRTHPASNTHCQGVSRDSLPVLRQWMFSVLARAPSPRAGKPQLARSPASACPVRRCRFGRRVPRMRCGVGVGGGTIRVVPPSSLLTATATPHPRRWDPGGAAALPVGTALSPGSVSRDRKSIPIPPPPPPPGPAFPFLDL